MKRPIHQLNKNSSLTEKLILMTLLMASASSATAEESDVAYVDSVLKWGAWELDIEPAAGGLSAATTKALNPRGSKVSLRTNSIAALAPPGAPERPIKPGIPSTPPVTPPPTVPTLTPISPNVPVPASAPNDGF